MNTEDTNLVILMKETWDSVAELMASLSGGDWLLPTDCPGWTVKDCFAHLIGIEQRLLGHSVPSITLSNEDLTHTKNELGIENQIDVVLRRLTPTKELIEEYKFLTSERLDILDQSDSFTRKRKAPDGRTVNERELISIRILDCWVHEQDIRRAIGRPGNLSGSTATHVFSRLNKTLPFILGKKVKLKNGCTAQFVIQGDYAEIISIGSCAGRAREIDDLDNPSVGLKMNCETYLLLCCGRMSSQEAVGADKVTITGDQNLGLSILNYMNFMP